MYAHPPLAPASTGVVLRRGGRTVVPRERASLGQLLPYRRRAGEQPPTSADSLTSVRRNGWAVSLGRRGLGDMLLGLGLVQALRHASGVDDELHYHGQLPRLMARCDLPLRVTLSEEPHRVSTHTDTDRCIFHAVPEHDPVWLDLLDEQCVEVHSALPMRYYLAAEQALGVRLPGEYAPCPSFTSTQALRPFHVVFVAATSWPDKKDYGHARFTRLAETLMSRLERPWTFTLIPGTDQAGKPRGDGPIDVLSGTDAADCLDVFASADVVVGNDTGLTHLAALTRRLDGVGPHVFGLYGRHAHNKWTTGRDRHHAIATDFSHLLSVADRCPVRDRLDDTVWGPSASLALLTPDLVADFVGHMAGWW